MDRNPTQLDRRWHGNLWSFSHNRLLWTIRLWCQCRPSGVPATPAVSVYFSNGFHGGFSYLVRVFIFCNFNRALCPNNDDIISVDSADGCRNDLCSACDFFVFWDDNFLPRKQREASFWTTNSGPASKHQGRILARYTASFLPLRMSDLDAEMIMILIPN